VSADPLATYLDLLFGAEPAGAFVEVRWRLRDRGGMGQLWRPVERKITALDSIRSIGAKTDCYVGCAPRTRQYGGKDAIERAHVLWADCDSPDAIAALERFEPSPSLVIRSGSGRHAYWALCPPAETAEVERSNRRLAHALGADMRATDCARILRAPSTTNWKSGSPVPVEIDHLAFEVYALAAVVAPPPGPPARPPRPRAVAAPTAHDDALLTIPPPVYIEALTGREVGRDEKVRCPFHEDRTPSLHAYNGPERGWTCFGCPPAQDGRPRGGSVIDFGGYLYGISPRGAGYHEVRRRLAADLLGRKAA